MDIKYQIAMANRATSFMKKYGKNSFRDSDGKGIGFKKEKLRCYNYKKPGHFPREWTNPPMVVNDIKIIETMSVLK